MEIYAYILLTIIVLNIGISLGESEEEMNKGRTKGRVVLSQLLNGAILVPFIVLTLLNL